MIGLVGIWVGEQVIRWVGKQVSSGVENRPFGAQVGNLNVIRQVRLGRGWGLEAKKN